MKRIAWIVGAIVVVLGLAGWFFHPWKKSEQNLYANLSRSKVQRGEFRITIEEQGLFETRKNDTIITPFSGKIVRLAEDGAHVTKGQTVVWMDTEKVTQDLRDQITQIKSVKAELEQRIVDLSKSQRNNTLDLASAGAELDFNRLQLLDVNKKLETMELLAELSLVPQRDLENSEINVESQKLDTLQKDLSYQGKTESRETKAKTQELDILQVSIRKDKAMADIDEAKKRLVSAELKAPADGLFLRISYWDWRQGKKTTAKEGTEVWSDQRIAQIPHLDTMIARCQVAESELFRVGTSTTVHIKLEAFPDLSVAGTVSRVGLAAMERERSAGGRALGSEGTYTGQKVFETDIALDIIDERLRPGMTAKVSYLVGQEKDAVFVPLKTVFNDNGKHYVCLATRKGYERRDVVLGERNSENVIVLKGLEKGDEVFLKDLDKDAKSKTSQNSRTPASPSG